MNARCRNDGDLKVWVREIVLMGVYGFYILEL